MSILSAAAVTELAVRALEKAGARPAMAEITARALVAADMQGLPTHGVSRVPFYCSFLRNGRADGKAEPRILKEKGAVCLIDNADGLPYASCALAVSEAIRRAREFGIGYAGITRSGHIGALALSLSPVVDAGMVGIALSNSPAAIPAWGGKKALYGTNPIAAVFPRKGKAPLVIDLSLTTVTRGKIMLAAQKNEPIPEGWALDREGRTTTDPKAVLEGGSLFPIGGVKGAMLALAFELLCTALTGAAIGREADSFFSEQGNKPRIGQAFLVIDPAALAGDGVYHERIETLLAAMLSEPGVRLPGARRHAAEAAARSAGISVSDELLRQLEQLAAG
jgi:(2R)-3-sulfolactate dehydrogenase (NADP+)